MFLFTLYHHRNSFEHLIVTAKPESELVLGFGKSNRPLVFAQTIL